ncbi:MAG: branched-chain amino acid transaminase [Myxococcales bacterium]|jgi:branched-chain amino acid aminotransferase|nr:MAG: branched-chain amino acid transaminase [Myxococcales bacterium]
MDKAKLIWMDGELVPWDEARVHVLTHTLHYGVGAFEGIRCYRCEDGRSAVFRLHEHIVRLWQSARVLAMATPYDVDQMEQACLETIRANELDECYIRPLLYVGDGEMGLAAPNNPVRLSVAVWPWGAYLGEDGLRNGIRVRTSSFQRYHVNTMMTKAKAVGHYVNSILASLEARSAGYDESLMLDVDGYAAEGCGENLFIVRGGRIKTPPIATVLEGITRNSAIELLQKAGYEVVEERFTRDEIYIADEAFLTGTAAEITPMRSLDDREIGEGKPGPVTKRLQEEYFAVIKGQRSEYDRWLTYL